MILFFMCCFVALFNKIVFFKYYLDFSFILDGQYSSIIVIVTAQFV
jgi:hypothetical protein